MARPLRALLCGPVHAADGGGGLQLALSDVACELRSLGWHVDVGSQFVPPVVGIAADGWRTLTGRSTLSILDRRLLLRALWTRLLTHATRERLSAAFRPVEYYRSASHNLVLADALLRDATEYDVVLFCIDKAAPGMCALVTEGHPKVVVLSLKALGDELRARRWWRLLRMLARRRLGPTCHPALFQSVDPANVRLAVFASRGWQREAVGAGLPASRTRTVYFGIPVPETPSRVPDSGNRLLWVGRLLPEKGLHHLVDALPFILHKLPDVTLTAIASPGPDTYRQWLVQRIEKLRLTERVILKPPIPRTDLPSAYAKHDLLYFYSMFEEPVALVLMEAYAAGLPVVASHPAADTRLVQDGVTCVCYRPGDVESLTSVVVAALTERSRSEQLAANARRLVRDEFSLPRMGQAYDQLLREFIATA